MNPRCLIVGIGNPDRGDDAAGPLAADLLARQAPAGTRIEVLRGDPAPLIEWLEQAEHAWLIDAADAGDSPGSIRRFDLARGAVPEQPFALSTHGFGLADTLELARALNALPATCVVYSIQGGSFEDGAAPCPQVRTAVREVAGRILEELHAAPGHDD
jgi:hydrogenase maturation protease